MRSRLSAFTVSLLALLAMPASAQNNIVPTAPPGTNNNQAASTAFVQNAVNHIAPPPGTICPLSSAVGALFTNTTGAPTDNTINFVDGTQCVPWAVLNQTANTVTLTPSFLTVDSSVLISGGIVKSTVSPAGTIPAVPSGTFFNPLGALFYSPSDNASSTIPGVHYPTLFDIEQIFGGSSINDGRNALGVVMTMNAATSPSNTNRFYGGVNAVAVAVANDNGTSMSPQGNLYGSGAVAELGGGATFWQGLFGTDIEVSADAGSSVSEKVFLSFLERSTDVVSGTLVDAYIWASAVPGAVGLLSFIQIDGNAGQYPLNAAGTVIKSQVGTVANVLDFSTTTVSNNFAVWGPAGAYSLSGAGVATLSAATLSGNLTTNITGSTQCVQVNSSGVLSGSGGLCSLPASAALTKFNDTNVTLTLGGTPATALLQAVSITAGWTGTLAVARGGTACGAASGTCLDNITGFASTGIAVRTGAGAYAFDSIAATAPITVANGSGVAGNPTLACATCVTSSGGGAITGTAPISVSGAGVVSITSPLPVGNGGTNCAAASGTCLDNITGFASTGFLTRTGAGTYAFQSATNGITLGNIAQSGANTMLGNWTGSTANVAANAMPSCADSGGNHLNYVSGTGITCGTGLGNGITGLTGDVTATGPGSVAATLATVNANTGSFGSSTAIPNITVNGKGLITAAGSNAVIAPAGTLTGTTLASNVVTTSITTVATIGTGLWQGTPVGLGFGGTGANITATSGGIPYFSSTSAMGSSAVLASTAVVVGGGAGSPPATTGCTIDANTSLICTSAVAFTPQNIVTNTTNDANSAYSIFRKSRSGGAVQNGDILGHFIFQGFANGAFNNTALFQASVDQAPSGSNVSTQMSFFTSDNVGGVNEFLRGLHTGSAGISGGLSVGSPSTDAGVGNIKATGTLTVVGMTNVATTSAVCYNTGTGLLTYDGTVGTCTTSTLRSKDLIAPLSDVEGLSIVMAMEPWWYTLKPGLPTYQAGEQMGMVADFALRTEPRVVAMNPDGTTAGFRYEQYTAALTAAMKWLKRDNDALWKELSPLRAANDNLRAEFEIYRSSHP